MPNTDAAQWTRDDRLYRAVTIDYISGMSQRSYLFEKANQETFRPMLEWSLDRAGLLATNPTAAAYALQIDFIELDQQSFGVDFAGRSTAIYTLVDRRTGEVIFSQPIAANFIAFYEGLNESDLENGINIAKPGVLGFSKSFAGYVLSEGVVVEAINNNEELTDFFDGPITEATQGTWDDVTQTFVWGTGVSLYLGLLEVVRQQLDPTNYVAFANGNGNATNAPRGARRGALSESGVGDRSGGKRARQANAQMLAQSITKFVITLGVEEDIDFVAILPCTNSAAVEELKTELMMNQVRWRTPGCTQNDRNRDSRGLEFTSLK